MWLCCLRHNPLRIFAAHELAAFCDPSMATKMTVQFNLFGGELLHTRMNAIILQTQLDTLWLANNRSGPGRPARLNVLGLPVLGSACRKAACMHACRHAAMHACHCAMWLRLCHVDRVPRHMLLLSIPP